MTDTTKETLSALLDSEVDDLELRRLLRALDELPAAERGDLEATWSRYHLAQSVLHTAGVPVSASLQERIAAQLEQEAIPGGVRAPLAWQQQLARLAIAASVAVVVVLGVQSALQPGADLPLAGTDTVPGPTGDAVAGESLLADADASGLDPESEGLVYEYIRSIVIDPTEPAGFEHIADSPLYRLVNQLQVED